MAEIRAVPDSGLRVISTFAGAGGSSLGYRLAGFRILLANEFVEAARETYEANKDAETVVDPRDIRNVRGRDWLASLGLQRGDLDLLDGSPPCASFSAMGKREAGWGKVRKYSDTEQRADDLFYEFARLVDELQPRTFVAENVAGLVRGVSKGYFIRILERLKGCGYRVKARVLDAQWLGVPQTRTRVIFVGVRNDLACEPVHPKPLPYRYSIADALPWLADARLTIGDVKFKQKPGNSFPRGVRFDVKTQPVGSIAASAGTIYSAGSYALDNAPPPPRLIVGGDKTRSLAEPAPTIVTHGRRRTRSALEIEAPPIEDEADISRFAIGAEYEKLAPGAASKRYYSLKRPRLDAPSFAISAAGGNTSAAAVAHPTERRKFSIGELKRLCGFPDDFELTGTYAQRWERLGRAVPPPMAAAIALAIRSSCLREPA